MPPAYVFSRRRLFITLQLVKRSLLPAFSAAAVAAKAAAAAIFTRLGFVDLDVATVDIFAVKAGDRGLRFFFRRHLDESESARAARVAVLDHAGCLNCAG